VVERERTGLDACRTLAVAKRGNPLSHLGV
jgi:hypothetical protein